MNELAVLLNQAIEGTAPFRLLSQYGKRFYFPSKGIVAQAAEAKEQATLYDATVGMACLHKKPIELSQIKAQLSLLTEEESVAYAPTPGVLPLRQLWKKEIYRKNPELQEAPISLPVVVPGLTAGISQIADLFFDKGDTLVLPDLFWGNYRLIFEERKEAALALYPFFNSEKTGLDLKAFKTALLQSAHHHTIKTLLNFPNNPTGYSPSAEEAQQIADLFLELANDGYDLLVLIDDAYFGLFYEASTYSQSLFAKLANLHPNVLAVKIDGTTKEHFSWGFRVGFVSFGCKGYTDLQYQSLVQKLSGSLRASFSNSSRPAQSILLKALSDPDYETERKRFDADLKLRYQRVRDAVNTIVTTPNLQALPCNSGYFMAFRVNGDANSLRQRLLTESGIGTISIQDRYLRVAFSAVDADNITDLYQKIQEAAAAL